MRLVVWAPVGMVLPIGITLLREGLNRVVAQKAELGINPERVLAELGYPVDQPRD